MSGNQPDDWLRRPGVGRRRSVYLSASGERGLFVRFVRVHAVLLAMPFEYFSNIRPAHGGKCAKV